MGVLAWPYNDASFLRRCVAIWAAHGADATVTWEWPDAIPCPSPRASVTLLRRVEHEDDLLLCMFFLLGWVLLVVCVGVRRCQSM